jgi:hypothetical protein
MKRLLVIAFTLSLLVVTPLFPVRGQVSAQKSGPCNPTVEQVHNCLLAGGQFDYGLCRCVLP